MIVFFIPGILNPAQFLSGRPYPEPAAAKSEDRVLPQTAPYTEKEAHEVYRACVNLAATMEKARELEAGPEIVWLVEQLNGTALRVGKKGNVPFERLLHAIDLVAGTCEETPLGPKETKQRDNWKLADAEGFRRLLPMVLQVLEDDEERDSAGAAVSEPSEAFPLLVSTSEGYVHLHHDGVGQTYDIELARIPDPGALLKWIEHIGAKTWVSASMIRLFVSAVCSTKGWKFSETSSL